MVEFSVFFKKSLVFENFEYYFRFFQSIGTVCFKEFLTWWREQNKSFAFEEAQHYDAIKSLAGKLNFRSFSRFTKCLFFNQNSFENWMKIITERLKAMNLNQ